MASSQTLSSASPSDASARAPELGPPPRQAIELLFSSSHQDFSFEGFFDTGSATSSSPKSGLPTHSSPSPPLPPSPFLFHKFFSNHITLTSIAELKSKKFFISQDDSLPVGTPNLVSPLELAGEIFRCRCSTTMISEAGLISHSWKSRDSNLHLYFHSSSLFPGPVSHSKYSPEYLRALVDGRTNKEASRLSGIAARSLARLLAKNRIYKYARSEDVQRAAEIVDDIVHNRIRTFSGPPPGSMASWGRRMLQAGVP